jgi:DNA-directed RNA polymerase specialized sigma24 family protein
LQLHRSRERFDIERYTEFVPWACQVARNRCIDLLRQQGRISEIPVEEMDACAPPTCAAEMAQISVGISAGSCCCSPGKP